MLLERRGDVAYSVSCTTRPPRNGEVDGHDYHFLSREDFSLKRTRGEFAEWAEVHGNLYGTLKSEVVKVLGQGRHVVMDIDVQGARQFMASRPDSVLVFLLPPSADALIARLQGRKTESPEATLRRMKGARDELGEVDRYHYVVVNDDLERAYRQVSSIVDAEAVRHRRIPQLAEQVRGLVGQLDMAISTLERAT